MNTIGTPYGKVEIVAHHSDWANAFEKEKELLQKALGNDFIKIEHVGSTAIPGISAKPTLDILVGLKELNSVDHYLPALEEISYQFRPNHPVPGRLHFAKIHQSLRTHNLSLTKCGSEFWEGHILFRDYLRAHPAERDAYQALKLQLAEEHPDNTVNYTNGKDEFIAQVMQKARVWKIDLE